MLRTLRRSVHPAFSLLFAILVVALVVATLQLVTGHWSGELAGQLGAAGATGAAALKAMVIIPWDPPRTKANLDAISNPTLANQPEVVPWFLYDTAAVTTGVATPLVFFVNQNVDKTLSNMEGPGQLPDPQYFELFYVAADILQVPTATALAGEPNAAWANVENILKTVRATFLLEISGKKYGPFPLTSTAATGGATGAGYGYGTAANGTSAALVNSGIPGSGGFPFSGAVVIPPKVGFSITVSFAAAPTITGGPINLRMVLAGNLYRRVL